MTSNLDSEDSLYRLACECEELFNQVQEAIPNTRLEVIVIELFAEFQQRFSIWAAHLGVFARKSQCLDTRLRNLPDLQDLVARLLDILRRNLQQCKNEIDSQRERDQASIGLNESKASLTQTETLTAIDNTLARLNRLGVTIRRSSYDKVDERATKFAAGLELESFLYLCANTVQTLYPNAQQSLKDYLSKSMTDRYAKMLFLYSRHHNLKIRREPPTKLPPIPELPNNETQDNVRLTQPAGAIPVVAKYQRLPTLLSQSDLSSVNIQKIQSRPRPPDEASTIFYKTSSVQVNQGNYPRQPTADGDSAVFTCEWCFELLNKEILSESKWRQHIDRDLEPYICLSEECSEMHPIYPTFDKWFSHMESHGRRWYQHVYLSSSWVCTVCEFNPDVYSNPQALYSHLKASHDGEFTNEELQVISRQSKTEQPRAWNDCLLCCFAIDEQRDRSEVRPPERWKESPKQKIAAGPKETYTTTNISHHSSDSDFSDTSSDSDDMVSQRQRLQQTQSRSKAIARHIAVHLQVLMLLTLRFAALQKEDEALDDDIRSDSVDIDDANSASMGNDLGRLSDIDLELDVMDDGNNSGDAMNLDDAVEDDIQIPDTDLDLNYVPRPYDNLVAENDAFLKKIIESGAYQPISQDYAKAVCVIPYPPNKDLVHRQDLIHQVDRLLPQTPGFCSAALWGLGGSGKTQIALDYAYRRCDDSKCCVFWVHADSEAAFIADYKTIGKRLGVDKRLNEWNLLDAVRSSIEAQSQWVVIFDDADDLKLFGVGYTEGENESLFRYIPRGPRGTILWTSRDAHIRGTLVDSHQSIKVSCMTHDEAIALLAVARGDKVAARDEGIYELLEGLQRLPLAVWQAGSYIRQTSMAIKEYLRLLTQGSSRGDLLRMDNLDRYQRPGVPLYLLEIWKISIERIREENELSYRILHIITYLNIQDIPYKVIVAASQYNGDEDRLEQIPEIEIQQAIVRLRKFSFLNILQEEGGLQSYIMHKVTQEAVRYVLGIQGPMKTTLSKSTPRQIKQEAHNLNFALHILYAIFSVLEKDSWEQCEGYISRAMQVTEWSEASGKEVEASALLDRVSGFLYDRGWWREKEPVDRRLLDLRRKALGEEHPDTITSMASLAATYHEQGRYGEAVMLEMQVLDLRQKVLGEKHPDTITSMASLVATYHEQGRYNDAEMLESQVLCLRREVLGAEHPHTMESMADLAAISHVQTQFKEHKPLR